jgi:hypothetical protein
MIRRNLLTAIVFILSCSACVLLSFATSAPCKEILNYSWTVQFGVGGVVFSLIKMFILWIAGITVWLLIRRKLQPRRYMKIKFLYFACLPLVIFSRQLLAVPGDILSRPMERSICEKTTTNGLKTESKNITMSEYDYLRTKFQVFPTLPLTAEKINISYYSDNFIGDHSLSIHFECGIREPIDTASHRWWVEAIEGTTGKKAVTFEIEGH